MRCGVGDADMVRNKIQDLPHAVRLQFRHPGVIILPRTDGRI